MTEIQKDFYSPHYWECVCEFPKAIHRTSVIECKDCGRLQVDCPSAHIRDLLDHNLDPYPYNCADIISNAQVAVDIISDVAVRNGRHASYITDELLTKNQYIKWIGSGKMVEIVTDGIGVFIAKAMNRVRTVLAGTMSAITIHKFTNERGDGNYIFISIAVNGIWLMSDGMTDFSGSGGRAFQDLSAVVQFWAWLYGVEVEVWQYSHEDYQKLMVNMQKMFTDDY